MHFLDSWSQLSPLEFARWMLPAVLLGINVFVPGRPIARVTAVGVALALLMPHGIGLSGALRFAWVMLWLVVAWAVGSGKPAATQQRIARPGGIESGAVGLLLGLALLTLLVVAVARQDLAPPDGRRASFGLLLVCLGLLHLMLRRDSMRAAVAFGTLGLGLQVLELAARQALQPLPAGPQGAVLLATLLAVSLSSRLARIRQRYARSTWVSEAHDLHD